LRATDQSEGDPCAGKDKQGDQPPDDEKDARDPALAVGWPCRLATADRDDGHTDIGHDSGSSRDRGRDDQRCVCLAGPTARGGAAGVGRDDFVGDPLDAQPAHAAAT